MKRAILILSILAIVVLVVGLVAFFGAAATAAANCTQTGSAQPQCASGATGAIAGGAALGLLGIIVGLILDFVAWILGLVKTAQIRRWGWFIAVFFLSPLSTLIYGIAGPDQPAM
jgi:predicted lipid-binding transport protein (Tim44 family)